MLPGSMSQQRWQQKPKQFKQQQSKHQSQNKKTSSSSSTNPGLSSSSSSVVDLPETFGLPANKTAKTIHPKYSLSNTSIQPSSVNATSSSASTLLTSSSTNQVDSSKSILIEDMSETSQPIETKSDDIEIISETYPTETHSSLSSTAVSTNALVSQSSTALLHVQANNEETFKNYLAKNYNSSGHLAVASKPQCNFMSNLACINQILKECDYYNKLKRRKPYSNIKLNRIYSENEESDDGDNENEETQEKNKIKAKKIIVIDDSNEEMHKPWITPDLIKLIKHRNLLQSKLNESNTKIDGNSANLSVADMDLLKKFKNLRNKVTKLVKKARSIIYFYLNI